MKKIVIVGGGASGMMAAIAAAKENPAAQIRILERKDLGKAESRNPPGIA